MGGLAGRRAGEPPRPTPARAPRTAGAPKAPGSGSSARASPSTRAASSSRARTTSCARRRIWVAPRPSLRRSAPSPSSACRSTCSASSRPRRTCSAAAAFRPGDIVTTAAGLTVEITNPDAEGRLILADGLWYARREGATQLVDVATLTGAMRAAIGDVYGGVFANDDAWRDARRRRRRRERRPRLALAAASRATAACSTRRSPTCGTPRARKLRLPVIAAAFLRAVRRRDDVGAPRHPLGGVPRRGARLPRAGRDGATAYGCSSSWPPLAAAT